MSSCLRIKICILFLSRYVNVHMCILLSCYYLIGINQKMLIWLADLLKLCASLHCGKKNCYSLDLMYQAFFVSTRSLQIISYVWITQTKFFRAMDILWMFAINSWFQLLSVVVDHRQHPFAKSTSKLLGYFFLNLLIVSSTYFYWTIDKLLLQSLWLSYITF